MKTRRRVTLICGLALEVSAAALGWRRVTVKSRFSLSANQQIPQISAADPAPNDVGIPKHVAYGLFFAELSAFKKRAEENERQGRDGSSFRNQHKERAKLSEQQSQLLDSIAADCNKSVLRLNARAKIVINRDRARHPHGKLREGESLPVPPEELGRLEEERTGTVLAARERLRQAFGEREFRRFDDFVQQDIESRAKAVPRGAMRP